MFIGIGLPITNRYGVGGSVSSGAMALLAGETQGLALDFTDDFWQASSGFYGSAAIKDTGTPANNYDNSPTTAAASLLTYTSPSVKMTRGPTGGLFRYQAHNLYLNSAAPGNQAITVVSGATYAVTITGTVSVTASGAATGTWTAGTQTFTAATTTLTFGSTSGAGTVHVRRTPSDSTYLATAGSIRYALPFEWNTSGELQGILVEEARTWLALYNRDFTNAAWTKSNMTAAKTATGPDGVANSASTLTATAGNATVLQAITSVSAARISSAYVKRRTGVGTIEMTQDNGSTWTAVTVTADWTRVNIAAATLTDPIVGFRIVTSGDAIDVDFFGHEVGSFITSPIETFGSTVTRAADNISLATSAFPYTKNTQTLMYGGKQNITLSGTPVFLDVNAGGYRTIIALNQCSAFDTGGDTMNLTPGTPSLNTPFRYAMAIALNDGAAVLDGGTVLTDSSLAVGGTDATTLFIGRTQAISNLPNGYIKTVLYLPRRMSNAELQTLTTP
jgi:hypothetical protein